jgi:hypothetical protein
MRLSRLYGIVLAFGLAAGLRSNGVRSPITITTTPGCFVIHINALSASSNGGVTNPPKVARIGNIWSGKTIFSPSLSASAAFSVSGGEPKRENTATPDNPEHLSQCHGIRFSYSHFAPFCKMSVSRNIVSIFSLDTASCKSHDPQICTSNFCPTNGETCRTRDVSPLEIATARGSIATISPFISAMRISRAFACAVTAPAAFSANFETEVAFLAEITAAADFFPPLRRQLPL